MSCAMQQAFLSTLPECQTDQLQISLVSVKDKMLMATEQVGCLFQGVVLT